MAQSTTMWDIGKNDGSAKEFPAGPSPQLVYRVGSSDWKSDWMATELVGAAYEIDFPLQSVTPAKYVLTVSLQPASNVVPAIRIDVNGHGGLFYLNPKLTHSDLEATPVPLSQIVVGIPKDDLHPGINRLVLTCVDVSQHKQSGITPGIKYDYLSLTREIGQTPDTIAAVLTPTIFYRKRPEGLLEVVNAKIRFNQPSAGGEAELVLKGRHFTAPLAREKDFGEQSIDFEVPEWTGPAEARLLIKGGHPKDFTFTIEPARKWKLFVVPHTHLDIGYTDYQGKVAEVQARALQDAMQLMRQHPDFKFATDGSWNVEQFMETRSDEQRHELMEAAKAGRIGIPVNYANLLTGYASLETLYRSLYYSKSLAQTFGIPFDYSAITDVPTYTGAYPSILASSGIRYLAVGGNGDRGPLLQHEEWDARSPFWWQGTDGRKVLFWYAHNYSQIEAVFGLPPQLQAGRDTLPLFLTPYTRRDYKPDAVLVYGAQSENTELEPALAGFAAEWNGKYAFPKFQYSTFAEFFRYIDQNYGTSLATYKGDLGPYWEDGVAADAANTAQDRMNQNRAISTDIISAVAHLQGLGFHPPKDELDSAWRNIQLYSEHTWTGGMSVTQPHMDRVESELAVKDNRATQAKFQLEDVANRAIGHLGDQIHVPAKTLIIFNGLNWKRNVLVETDLRKNESLVDLTTGLEIPVEVLWRREGFTRARFIVPNVPPVGYNCVQFKTGDADVADVTRIAMEETVENQFYRVTVDRSSGSLRSIFDKQLKRELVDQGSPYRFGQTLYVTGGDGKTSIINSDPALPRPSLTVHASQDGKYLGTKKTPWGHAIHLQSSAANARVVDLEILLFDSEKKIQFNYKVEKRYTEAKEALYFAFPVAIQNPNFAYEIQQGWVDPAVDLMKGGSAEWFTIQHWMAVHDDHLAVGIVPVDAPMAALGDIVRGDWPGVFKAKSSTLFSYVMNNYWHTNYQAGQDGVFNFRYIITSSERFAPAVLSRTGWESMEPVELNRVIVPDKIDDPDRPLPAAGASFLEVDGSDLVLTEWKLAEDGKGTIVRLQETAGNTAAATIRVPLLQLRAAALCNAVEDDERQLKITSNAVHVSLKPHEVVTLRLKIGDEE